MGHHRELPKEILEAQSQVRKWMLVLGGWLLTFSAVTFAILASWVSWPVIVASWLSWPVIAGLVMAWLAGCALIFWKMQEPLKELERFMPVIREFQQRRARELVASTLDNEDVLEADDPLHAMASRVRKLGGDDPRVSELVDTLLLKLANVGSDVRSLREAIATEQSLDTTGHEPRVERLARALTAKEALMAELEDALRDLHVELTLRQDDDHQALFSQVSDLLAGLSAETEVDELVCDADNAETDANTRRRMKAMQAQRDRSG